MSRHSRRMARKGATNRHHVITIKRDGRELYYHATKGWKSRRA